MAKALTYKDAGVDIDKADRFVGEIKAIARKTFIPGVMGELGGFGALFSLNTAGMDTPVLVSSTDGVGTKLKIAFAMGRHDTVGIDLVGMCVNDIAVQGARPLFFLDYLSMGELSTQVAKDVLKGIAEGCRQAKCALIGGETAEMPGMYKPGEYDLAGFAVGVVDNDKIVDGSEIGVGHKLVGVASSGLHSNGYSLVRKICFDILKLRLDLQVSELGCSLGEELLKPTRIYTQTIQRLMRDFQIHGLAHITGGGIANNVVRILPNACGVVLKRDSWDIPPVFTFLQQAGRVSDVEMMRTFNNGLGLIVVVPDRTVQEILERLSALGETAFIIGEVVERQDGERIQWRDA